LARSGSEIRAFCSHRVGRRFAPTFVMKTRLFLEASVSVFAIGWLAACGSSETQPFERTRSEADPAAPIVDCPGESRPASIPDPPKATKGEAWGDGKAIPANLVIDVSKCESNRFHAWLALGSSWVQIEPGQDPNKCRVWLGGEMEDPLYDGKAAQYCELSRTCARTTIEIAPGGGRNAQGGAPHVEAAGCTP
jgi:hypothetical protein